MRNSNDVVILKQMRSETRSLAFLAKQLQDNSAPEMQELIAKLHNEIELDLDLP